MVEPYSIATNQSSAVASLRSVTKTLRILGYSDSSAVLAWAVLALYTVLFLLAAAFVFRRQEAQA